MGIMEEYERPKGKGRDQKDIYCKEVKGNVQIDEKKKEEEETEKEINTTINKEIKKIPETNKGVLKNWNASKRESYKNKYNDNKLTNKTNEENKIHPVNINRESKVCKEEREPKESDFWEKIGHEHPENLIKEKIEIDHNKETDGPTYKIVSRVGKKCIVMTMDSGAFTNIISKEKAQELDLEITETEKIEAKAATGPVILEYITWIMI